MGQPKRFEADDQPTAIRVESIFAIAFQLLLSCEPQKPRGTDYKNRVAALNEFEHSKPRDKTERIEREKPADLILSFEWSPLCGSKNPGVSRPAVWRHPPSRPQKIPYCNWASQP